MPRNVGDPPRGTSVAVGILSTLALAAISIIWFLILKPEIFDSMQNGTLYLIATFLAAYGFVQGLILIVKGASARRLMQYAFLPLIPLQATNSTSTQNQALQVIEYFMANPFVIISLVVGILGGLVVLLDRLGLLKGFRKALDKTYEWEY